MRIRPLDTHHPAVKLVGLDGSLLGLPLRGSLYAAELDEVLGGWSGGRNAGAS